jgi:SulP family sulfate permease
VARQRTVGVLTTAVGGVVIGAVEVVLAISFAALVFGGYLDDFLDEGIGIYLVAATITLAGIAWRAGKRGPVGSVQDAAAAVLGVVATTVALGAFGSPNRAFLTVVAATAVVTFLTALTFLAIGVRRLGNLVRFVPYPVMGGFLAGTGWLLFKGGIGVAASILPYTRTIDDLLYVEAWHRWVPALVYGVILLVAVRVLRRPSVLPVGIAIGIALFAVGMVVSGSSLQEAQRGLWLLGPFPKGKLLDFWTVKAFQYADWSAIADEAAGIATAVFVAVIAALFNITGTELILRKDLDTNRELRDAGIVNIASSAFGGIPGYHALSLTALGDQMATDPRWAGLVAAIVPLTAVVFGAQLVALIPRMVVGGVLVYVGLSFMVGWLWDTRRSLPRSEFVVLLVIFLTIVTRGLIPGVAVGLVAAMALFAYNYSRVDQLSEAIFGDVYRSNVDRPLGEREALRTMANRVLILRVRGFVFFGTISALLERIRARTDEGALDTLVIDLRGVSGLDASAVVAFTKVTQLARTHGAELVLAGASEHVRSLLERGGVVDVEGAVRYEPDLDRALQRSEERLLAEVPGGSSSDGSDLIPADLEPYLERLELADGDVLFHQGDEPGDLYVLEAGRLRVEMRTPAGAAVRLATVRPGVTVGEMAIYTGDARTADVVAEGPCVVRRLGAADIRRMEREAPALAASLHRWIATELAERHTQTLRSIDALRD